MDRRGFLGTLACAPLAVVPTRPKAYAFTGGAVPASALDVRSCCLKVVPSERIVGPIVMNLKGEVASSEELQEKVLRTIVRAYDRPRA